MFIRRTFLSNPLSTPIVFALSALLAACGGGGSGGSDAPATPAPNKFTIGGTVSGLNSGASLTLQNNGGDTRIVSTSGSYAFSTALAVGATYNITIATQPSGQTCTVVNGSGTVNAAVSNITITCTSGLDANAASALSQTHKPTLVGVVIDSPVINLHYDAPALDGATNNQGQFNYLPGDLIAFKVGDVVLPPVVGRPVITILDFAATTDINNIVVVNIARFLQSLDVDGDPSNGITISAQAHTAATGQSLDFSNANFDALANPIIAAAGGANTSLIDANTAIANLQAGLDALPKINPIVGAWVTGSGIGSGTPLRGIIFLENGMYYGLEANCNGVPNYEFGTYTYSGGNVVLAVSEDADGACGLNSGAQTVTVVVNTALGNSMTLDGLGWQDFSYNTNNLAGLYFGDGFIGSPAGNIFSFTLFSDTQYINFDATSCPLADAAIEVGVYSWDSVTRAMALTVLGDTEPNCGLSKGVSQARRGDSFIALLSSPGVLSTSGLKFLLAIKPAKTPGTLIGAWAATSLEDSGNLWPAIFTSKGKFFFTEADSNCPSSLVSGEAGSFIWDSISKAFMLSITSDSNQTCGFADLAGNNSDNFNLTRAVVTGNLLTVSSDTGGEGVLVKTDFSGATDPHPGVAGIWFRAANGGQPSALLTVSHSGFVSNDYVITALDGDCPTATTTYAAETLGVTITGTNGIARTTPAYPLNFDDSSCGLPATVGPTFSLNGDTLTIDQLGTFTREQ